MVLEDSIISKFYTKNIIKMTQNIFVKRLQSLRKRNKEKPEAINFNLYKLICNQDLLVAGYERIKSNTGATTPGVDKISLDGFGAKRLEKLIIGLKNESWKPRPARRIYIPKPGKTEKRPLGIQGPEEKIVQAAMLLVLEAVYEPIFYKTSFGFRPGKGCHDALQTIYQNYDGMRYAIEGDIKGMYDNVNHHTLVALMKKKIKDERFIRLTYKMLRAGYMEGSTTVIKPVIGTPQGSIVSPILANIYLHNLDTFMAERVKNVPKRKQSKTCMYKRLINEREKISRKIKKDDLTNNQRRQYIKEIKAAKWQSLKIRPRTNPSNRIHYTRYADDFIVGIAGSLEYTINLKKEIQQQLENLDLTLSEKKAKITNLRTDSAHFLGHNIRINTSTKYAYVHPNKQKPYLKRVTGHLVNINAPNSQIVHRLNLKGFCNHKGFPTHKKLWVTQEDHVIIQNFNATIRGLFGFYSGVNNPAYLSRFWYILQYSCAMTLAAKHRSSISKIFKKHKSFTKYGKTLKVHYGNTGEKSIDLYIPSLKVKDRKWQTGKQVEDPYKYIAARVSKTKLFENCCMCGSSGIEMHHIKHVKGSRSGYSRIMSLLNRKQIPVCRDCHMAIHAGKYDGVELKQFANLEVARR